MHGIVSVHLIVVMLGNVSYLTAVICIILYVVKVVAAAVGDYVIASHRRERSRIAGSSSVYL